MLGFTIMSPIYCNHSSRLTQNENIMEGMIAMWSGCYKNKRRKSLLVLHVCARYKDYYIIILGANII